MDPNQCVMEDCDKPLGPDALMFEHNGKPAGGICKICLDDAAGVRVMFEKNKEGTYIPSEIAHIDKVL